MWRCSAFIASLSAPNFQRFGRVSSKVIFSIFASRYADVAVLALNRLLLQLDVPTSLCSTKCDVAQSHLGRHLHLHVAEARDVTVRDRTRPAK
jgi:hypothetical protein